MHCGILQKTATCKVRKERIELALDIMASFGKLLRSHVLGLKYNGWDNLPAKRFFRI
jgi:hypothetical protein